MRLLALMSISLLVIQFEASVGYKSEIEITPSPIDEPTTKKSGWFGGIKNFFGSSGTTTSTTTTPIPVSKTVKPTAAPNHVPPQSGIPQKPPPLVISNVPLMPLGPRPDTPPTSPIGGNQQQPPLWPNAGTAGSVTSTTTTTRTPPAQGQPKPINNNVPNLPPGFGPYRPSKPQPSGIDLTYGGGNGMRAGGAARPPIGLAPLTTPTTTTTTTTVKPNVAAGSEDLRGGSGLSNPSTTSTTKQPSLMKDAFPALPAPKSPKIKEDFPVLPALKSPSPIPASPLRPSSPSAWNVPLSTPAPTNAKSGPTPASPVHPANSVAFVPHVPSVDSGTTTTVRPGVSGKVNAFATDDEIRQLTEQLYNKESNSQLNLITVNIQGKTRSIDSADMAPEPLLNVDPKALQNPTIVKLQALLDNYQEDTLVNEHISPLQRKEENDFVDAIMATSVMRQAMLFLQQKGLVSPDPKTHRELVKELWFTQYSRGQGKIGSSGFEHVFVHEVKNGTIIGLHNWVYINQEEQAQRFDYKGYLKQMDLGTKGKVLKIRFTHKGLNKPVNTMFVGTSPELEIALYTVCFQLRPDRTCPVSLGNNNFGIVTYSWRYRGKTLIGSAYPEI